MREEAAFILMRFCFTDDSLMFCSSRESPAQHYLKDIYYLEDVGGLEQSKISEVSNESRKKPGMKICFPKCDLKGQFC